jgi:hypothetical protein
MNPLDILEMDLRSFHILMALGLEGSRQNIRPMLKLKNSGKKGGMAAGIAYAVYAGNKASGGG